jgi:hypothetical protein
MRIIRRLENDALWLAITASCSMVAFLCFLALQKLQEERIVCDGEFCDIAAELASHQERHSTSRTTSAEQSKGGTVRVNTDVLIGCRSLCLEHHYIAHT